MGRSWRLWIVLKYLGVWIDRWLRGNVHMEQMVEKAEEWIGKVEWMSKVNV